MGGKIFAFEINLSQENLDDKAFLLYSAKNGDTGPNLTRILSEVHNTITHNINSIVGQKNEFLDHKLLVKSDVNVSFSQGGIKLC